MIKDDENHGIQFLKETFIGKFAILLLFSFYNGLFIYLKLS